VHCVSSLRRPPHNVRGRRVRCADANDSRSIQTIVPRELKRVNEEDEDQIAKQEQQQVAEGRRTRRVEFGRLRTLELYELGH
jgi:hypothetical protein